MLQIPNTESNSQYLRYCKVNGISGHPARFPEKLPEFFIEFLTDTNDIVVDIFAGSNTTGAVAEKLGRRWLAFEKEQKYLAASTFRFLPGEQENTAKTLFNNLITQNAKNLKISTTSQMMLFETQNEYKTP